METNGRGINGSAQEETMREGRITQHLVDEIADKVYAMLLRQLKIETERHRSLRPKGFGGQGGW